MHSLAGPQVTLCCRLVYLHQAIGPGAGSQ
jgi:hypothetical protein